MARLRYEAPRAVVGAPALVINIPGPDTIGNPEVKAAAAEFQRLEEATAAAWAELEAARRSLEAAEARDTAARREAIAAGRKPTSPRKHSGPAGEAVADAQAVHEDTRALRDEAAAALAAVVVAQRDAIVAEVEERSIPLRDRLRELAELGRPLQLELLALEEWAELEWVEPGGTTGGRLVRAGRSIYTEDGR